MDAAILISAASAVVSFAAVCGTFYGVRYTNRINRQMQDERLHSEERRQNRDMLRAKGEELVTLIGTYEAGFRDAIVQMSQDLITTGTLNIENLVFRPTSDALVRIEMLGKIYFPAAGPHLQEVRALYDSLTPILDKIFEEDRNKVAKHLMMLSFEMDNKSKALQRAVIEILQALHRDLVHPPHPASASSSSANSSGSDR